MAHFEFILNSKVKIFLTAMMIREICFPNHAKVPLPQWFNPELFAFGNANGDGRNEAVMASLDGKIVIIKVFSLSA
jgi:hypothetical protein